MLIKESYLNFNLIILIKIYHIVNVINAALFTFESFPKMILEIFYSYKVLQGI